MIFSYWTNERPGLLNEEDQRVLDSMSAEWRETFSGFKIFSDTDLLPLLAGWDQRLPDLFSRIRIPACRSDLARLVLLHAHGGLYIDAHVGLADLGRLANCFERLASKELLIFYRFTPPITDVTHLLMNSVIMARRQSPILAKIIRAAVSNLENHEIAESLAPRHVDYNIYALTGPWNMSLVLFDHATSDKSIRPEYDDLVEFYDLTAATQPLPVQPYRHYGYRKSGSHWSERQLNEPLFALKETLTLTSTAPASSASPSNPTAVEMRPDHGLEALNIMTNPPRPITVIANCHCLPLADALALGVRGITTEFIDVTFIDDPLVQAKRDRLFGSDRDDIVFSFNLSSQFGALETGPLRQTLGQRLLTFTNIHFNGLHPDITYLGPMRQRVGGIFGDYHSQIVLCAFAAGWPESACEQLFCGKVYERFGYFSAFERAAHELILRDQACDIKFANRFLEMVRITPCLYTVNHPTGTVFLELSRALASQVAQEFVVPDSSLMPNHLAANYIWPLYNEIAEHHGLPYRTAPFFFRSAGRDSRALCLREFISGSYRAYETAERNEFVSMVRRLPLFPVFSTNA